MKILIIVIGLLLQSCVVTVNGKEVYRNTPPPLTEEDEAKIDAIAGGITTVMEAGVFVLEWPVKAAINASPTVLVLEAMTVASSMTECPAGSDMFSEGCIKACEETPNYKACPDYVKSHIKQCKQSEGKPWWCPKDLTRYL